MNPGDLLPYATGAGGALFVLITWIAALSLGRQIPESTHKEIVDDKNQQIRDKEQQIRDLTLALEREREKNNALSGAARDMFSAMREGLDPRREVPR